MIPRDNQYTVTVVFNLLFTVDPISGRSIFSTDISNNPTNKSFEIVCAINQDGCSNDSNGPDVNINLSFYLE